MSENYEQPINEQPINEQPVNEQPNTEQPPRILPTLQELNDPTELTRMAKKRHYSTLHWYAVYVHPGHEMQIHDYLMGIDTKKKRRRAKAKKEDLFIPVEPEKVLMECFVPLKRVHVKYSDRMVWKEKVQTPGIIFVHTILDNRDPLFHSRISEYVVGFLNDRIRHWPQPIPDIQMFEFKALSEADWLESVEKPTYAIGDKVLVLEGPLRGHVAYLDSIRESVSKSEYETDRQGKQILDNEGNPIYKRKTKLCVQLTGVLTALFEVDADKVVKAPADAPDYGVYD
jgi:transcription antitermination factor NusG